MLRGCLSCCSCCCCIWSCYLEIGEVVVTSLAAGIISCFSCYLSAVAVAVVCTVVAAVIVALAAAAVVVVLEGVAVEAN